AADVLRRVTGLSVSDGKFVFVRGLGERYSSTEVDGVRIASPEQNKRVVPLDLVPANLLENIVVQKAYSADRPGEFGGGDVQVHTRDFPGHRTWSLSITQGFSAESRRLPAIVENVPVTTLDPRKPSSYLQSAEMGKAFGDSWGARYARS